ncbi:MAG: hypothetical protein ACW98K_14375, partial [Candidatus Kariarchaeaceae archaeon]
KKMAVSTKTFRVFFKKIYFPSFRKVEKKRDLYQIDYATQVALYNQRKKHDRVLNPVGHYIKQY